MLCETRSADGMDAGLRIRTANLAARGSPAPARDWKDTTRLGVNSKVTCRGGWRCPMSAVRPAFTGDNAPYQLYASQFETSDKVVQPRQTAFFRPFNRMHFHILRTVDMPAVVRINENSRGQDYKQLSGWNDIDAAWMVLGDRRYCSYHTDSIVRPDLPAPVVPRPARDPWAAYNAWESEIRARTSHQGSDAPECEAA